MHPTPWATGAIRGNGVMGDDNIVVSGHWTKADVTVQTWKLTYKWSGLKDGEQLYDADGQEITENVKEPIDNRTYINKEPFAAEAGYFDGYQVYTHVSMVMSTANIPSAAGHPSLVS